MGGVACQSCHFVSSSSSYMFMQVAVSDWGIEGLSSAVYSGLQKTFVIVLVFQLVGRCGNNEG